MDSRRRSESTHKPLAFAYLLVCLEQVVFALAEFPLSAFVHNRGTSPLALAERRRTSMTFDQPAATHASLRWRE